METQMRDCDIEAMTVIGKQTGEILIRFRFIRLGWKLSGLMIRSGVTQ